MNQTKIDQGRDLQQPDSGTLPPFVTIGPRHADGWKVPEATGDYELDFALGGIYAEMAVKHARAINNPAFVSFVMASIYYKAVSGRIRIGGTEQGFLNRVARLATAGVLH